MSINASVGAKIYIGPVTAAADVTAYAALTYVEIGEVETIGEFGDSASAITFLALSAGRTRKLKGAKDAGNLAVVCASDPQDVGQLAAVVAEGTKFSYAFKILLEDSPDANDTDSVFYFHSKVMSAPITIGGANDVTKRTINLAIDTEIFADLSSAVA